MSADQELTGIRCYCAYCAGQGEGVSEAFVASNGGYYVPDPPKIPDPPGSSVTTAPPPEPGWSGPGFLTLIRGDDWNDPEVGIPAVVPYTFATRSMSHYATDAGQSAQDGFVGTSGEPLDAAQRANIRLALSMWEQVSGLTFVEVSDSPLWNTDAIRFSLESIPYAIDSDSVFDFAAYAAPTSGVYGSNIVFNRLHYADNPLQPGTYAFLTALHEIGHAIGLKHPFQDGLVLQASRDNNKNTVMSYTDKGNYTHLGPFDIDAVQYLYGTPAAKAAAPVQWSQGPNGSVVTTADNQANTIIGVSARDIVYAGGGDDYIATAGGDDYVVSGAGSDAVFGGAGEDTLYTGLLRQQAAVASGTGNDGIQGTIATVEGQDSFYGVEVLGFVDGSLALDSSGPVGQLYRLYKAAFDREPDAMGFAYWADAVQEGGTSVARVAASFADSAEFAARHGGLSDVAFVTQLYRDVLDRPPAPTERLEVNYWVDAIQAGGGRGAVVLGFSDTKENRTKTQDAFKGGLWFTNADAVDVLRDYMTVLDRRPDAGGLVNWTNAREAGLSHSDVIGHLASSPEFQARFGSLSNHDFVERLYLTALDRPASPNEGAYWDWVLDAGVDSRAGVALGFANSAEMGMKVASLAASHSLFV